MVGWVGTRQHKIWMTVFNWWDISIAENVSTCYTGQHVVNMVWNIGNVSQENLEDLT